MSFKINDYITLKLEDGKTEIYIKDEKFKFYCKPLILTIPVKNIDLYSDIETIDEAEQIFSQTVNEEKNHEEKVLDLIDKKTEFWGHCSNMQIWAEHDYNSSLLVYNLAFPLLKKLTDVGDPVAKKRYKEEVIQRFVDDERGEVGVFLSKSGFMKQFTIEEIEMILQDKKSKMKVVGEHNLWTMLGKNREGKEALECYRRALKLKLDSVKTWRSLSQTYFDIRDFDKAENSAKNALLIEPNNAILLTFFAEVKINKLLYEEAEVLLKKALKLDDLYLTNNCLAFAYIKMERYRDSLVFYKKCEDQHKAKKVKLSNAEVDSLWGYIYHCYDKLSNQIQAKLYFHKISEKYLSNNILFSYAVMCQRFGDYDEAFLYLDKIKKEENEQPIDVLVLHERARIYSIKREFEEERKILIEILKLDPFNRKYLSEMYQNYVNREDRVGGDEFLSQFQIMHLSSEEIINNIIEIYLYEDPDNFKEIKNELIEKIYLYATKLLEINPDSIIAYNNISAVFIKKNMYSKAIKSLKKLLALGPYFRKVFSDLSYSYYQCGKYKKAISMVEPSFFYDTEDSDYETRWTNLAKLFIDDGMYKNAIKICNLILKYKPNNKDILRFKTLLEK